MSFSGDVEVKTVELPDALEFIVTREDSLYVTVFAPVITFVALYFYLRDLRCEPSTGHLCGPST